jgi:AraC family transcriptional regulator
MLKHESAGAYLSMPFGTFYGHTEMCWRAGALDLAVLNADPARVVQRHTHADAHFVLVIEGLYSSSARGAPALSSGLALIFNPVGTTHRDTFVARQHRVTGRFMTVSIAAEFLTETDSPAHTAPAAVAVTDPRAMSIARQLSRECLEPHADALSRESLSLQLLTSVSDARMREPAAAPSWLATAREALDDRITEDVRIGDIAAAVGVHPVHLARVFQRHLGCAPGEYLRRRRVERAQVMLRETTQTLSTIALSCGFADQSHLSRVFGCAVGATPGAFRRGA